MNAIDAFLNRVTMYRLVLYYLILLLVTALCLCVAHRLPFDALSLAVSIAVLMTACTVTNMLFAKAFGAVVNAESAAITALILALVITPGLNKSGLLFAMGAGVLAMASKYLIAIRRKHVFNPVAVALVITAFGFNLCASWWVATLPMLPVVLIGGLLMVRKVQRVSLTASFLAAAALATLLPMGLSHGDISMTCRQILVESPLFFFAFVMLTEPLTTPPTRGRQVAYGALVGALFAPQMHVGSVYSTPELALLVGNLFSFALSPVLRLRLTLTEKTMTGPGTFDYLFASQHPFQFRPGQYLEWTLPVPRPDARGNRRFFTLASSPTEKGLRVGVKFYDPSSRFKQALAELAPGDTIVAGQLAGDFTLPKDYGKKCAFVAGGIGITPFRSMVRYLLDRGERRDIVLLYSNAGPDEILYAQDFAEAQERFGLRVVHALTDIGHAPADWQGHVGRIDEEMIRLEVPDYAERIFYLAGPSRMVNGFAKLLRQMGVPRRQIKVDDFPGFA